MGGERGVAEQRKRGKLTVRERVELLADPGTFREFMGLMGAGSYAPDDPRQLVDFLPKGAVDGVCKLNGRKAIFHAGDFTVRGGSGGSGGGMGMELSAKQRAIEWRLPYIRLLDAAGGSVATFEEMGRTYLPDGNQNGQYDVELLRISPVASVVLGAAAGLPAVECPLSHFSVMVHDISQIMPGGPVVVKQALGYDITKEELGGEQIHAYVSGVCDNLADTEEHAFEMVRRFLSFLPTNVWEMPPRGPQSDPIDRREEMLLSVMPRDKTQPYDVHEILDAVLDRGSFFEIAPNYGQTRITGLARVNGYPCGVMANNPIHSGGSTDVAGGSKVMRLIRLCDTFHLPLVSFCDEPGFMVGLESEKLGIERAGAQLICTTCQSIVPFICFITGRMFGVAGQCQHRPSGMFRRYAWPSARWGSMPIEGGTQAAYKREIESSPDPDARRAEIEASLQAIASPFRTAEATGQDIIDPRDTRLLLVGSSKKKPCCIAEKSKFCAKKTCFQQSSSRMPRPCCARSSAKRACPTCREALAPGAACDNGTSSVPSQGA